MTARHIFLYSYPNLSLPDPPSLPFAGDPATDDDDHNDKVTPDDLRVFSANVGPNNEPLQLAE